MRSAVGWRRCRGRAVRAQGVFRQQAAAAARTFQPCLESSATSQSKSQLPFSRFSAALFLHWACSLLLRQRMTALKAERGTRACHARLAGWHRSGRRRGREKKGAVCLAAPSNVGSIPGHVRRCRSSAASEAAKQAASCARGRGMRSLGGRLLAATSAISTRQQQRLAQQRAERSGGKKTKTPRAAASNACIALKRSILQCAAVGRGRARHPGWRWASTWLAG